MNLTYVLTAFGAAAISATVAAVLGRRSVVAVGSTVAMLLAAVSVWLLCSGLHELASSLEMKLLVSKFQYFGVVVVPPAMLVAALQYSGLGYLCTTRNLALLMLFPLTTLALVWSFPAHDLYWQEVVWNSVSGGRVAEYRRGPLFWVWIAYAYLCLLMGTLLLINYLHGAPSVFRGQYIVLFVAIISPWLGNVAYLLDLTPWPGVDTTAFGFVLTGLALGWGIMRLQLSNVVPLARRSILASMTEAVFVLDARGRLVDLNAAARRTISYYMKGEPEALIGETFSEAFSRLPALNAEVQKAVGEPSYRQNTEIDLGKPVTPDIQNLRISPVTDPGGSFLGTLVELRDMNSLRQAEEDRLTLESELRHARKLESLGVMAGGIAHDFNNLLTGILGHAELAEKELQHESSAASHLRQVREITQLAAELCQQLLAYSGKGQFDNRVLSINELIREMKGLLAVTGPKTVQIVYSLEEALPLVRADATQIQQLIMNLVINAAEAIGDVTGTITLSTGCRAMNEDQFSAFDVGADSPAGDYVVLTVSDTGIGMDAETREKIFDPFFTTKFTGRGLGMSAALGIIQGHKGALRIESEPGIGTTFQILLPVTDDQIRVRGATATNDQLFLATRGKILVIDDEPYIRDIAKDALRQLGLEVLTADDGLEGIAAFTAHLSEISAVLLDLSMPGMDGQVCYERLKQLDGDIMVIIMSGFHEKEVSQRFDDRENLRFLQKPFQISQLQEAIQALL